MPTTALEDGIDVTQDGPVGLGIIGCGVIGRRHLTSSTHNDGVTVVGVCDADEGALKRAITDFDVPAGYADSAELLADPAVDAVIVALPAGIRQPVALAALAAGKHLLTEKPVGMDSGQVRELIAARGDLTAACASSRQRYLHSATVAAETIASGVLGDLRLVRGRGVSAAPAKPTEKLPPPWRLRKAANGGGIMANWGCYDLDFLLAITGWSLQPQSVFALAWPIAPELRDYVVPDSDAETLVTALVRCAGDVALTLERGEYLPVAKDGDWEVIGTRGSIRLSMVPTPGNAVRLQRIDESGVVAETLWEGPGDGNDGHQGVFDDFIAAVATGSEPATTLEHALVVQQLTDAIYESAESGAAVPLR